MTRIALVTGASRGIGKSILVGLIKDNFTVIGTATSQENADNISESIKENKGEGFGFKLNINDNPEHQILLN